MADVPKVYVPINRNDLTKVRRLFRPFQVEKLTLARFNSKRSS